MPNILVICMLINKQLRDPKIKIKKYPNRIAKMQFMTSKTQQICILKPHKLTYYFKKDGILIVFIWCDLYKIIYLQLLTLIIL